MASVTAASPRAATFMGSTIGRKVVMAVTGFILFGFVLGHMAGNLTVYLGAEALNHYAEFLREFLHGAALPIARIVLLVSVILHMWAAVTLTMDNRKARPVGYRKKQYREATYASRTMMLGGPIIALFVVYHILHLTTGTVHPDFVAHDVYHNFIRGFQSVPTALFYIVANLALGLHLFHGVASLLQTLGLSHPRWNGLRRNASAVFALVVTIGNISFPVAVMSGLLR